MNKLHCVFLIALIGTAIAAPQYFEEKKTRGHGHQNNANKIGISSDSNRIVVGLNNKTSLVYNNDMEVIGSFESDSPLSSLAVGDDLIAIGPETDHIYLYFKDDLQHYHTTTDSYYTYTDVAAMTFSPDHVHLALGVGYYLDIYSTGPWMMSSTKYQDSYKKIQDVCFSPNGNYFASSSEQSVMVWSVNGDTYTDIKHIEANNAKENHVSMSNQYLAISYGDATVEIFDMQFNSVQVLTVTGETNDVVFSKTGEYLAVKTRADGVFIFDTNNWLSSQNILSDKDAINSIDFSNDRLLIDYTSGSDSSTTLWVPYGQGNGALNIIVSSIIMLFAFLLY